MILMGIYGGNAYFLQFLLMLTWPHDLFLHKSWELRNDDDFAAAVSCVLILNLITYPGLMGFFFFRNYITALTQLIRGLQSDYTCLPILYYTNTNTCAYLLYLLHLLNLYYQTQVIRFHFLSMFVMYVAFAFPVIYDNNCTYIFYVAYQVLYKGMDSQLYKSISKQINAIKLTKKWAIILLILSSLLI